jgi:hypothetical protein
MIFKIDIFINKTVNIYANTTVTDHGVVWQYEINEMKYDPVKLVFKLFLIVKFLFIIG